MMGWMILIAALGGGGLIGHAAFGPEGGVALGVAAALAATLFRKLLRRVLLIALLVGGAALWLGLVPLPT
ncbi:MAG: hypothetical protein O3A97_07205 [Proteobacteria bacterium]|nr:hypothetical protein [Pseudomonadota bacterium]